MNKFAAAAHDPAVSTQLLSAISDVNAFRTFPQQVRRLRLNEDWEAFRQEQLRLIAIEWCEAHGLPIV